MRERSQAYGRRPCQDRGYGKHPAVPSSCLVIDGETEP